MIAAMSKNRVIGRNNQLPWHLPADLREFRRLTVGKPVIMGRATWDSIGHRPLPNRSNIVISRTLTSVAQGVELYGNLEAGLTRARQLATEQGAEEIMVVGGEQIYRALLSEADRIYLTVVDLEVEDGDTFFPNLPDWQEISRQQLDAGDAERPACELLVLERLDEHV